MMEKKHSRSNSLVYLLERTQRQAKQLLQREFDSDKLNISVDQWIVLARIAERPGQNHKQLADSTAKDPASITRILALLLQQKFVKKTPDKKDKRSLLVDITPSGKIILTGCEKKTESFRKTAGKGLSQEDLNQLKKLLDMLYENSGGKLF
ncbi:MAG: MarR family transcriptional regulator [Bacteroidia bacterium]